MNDFEQAQEFRQRFEALKEVSGKLLSYTALTCARMGDFPDDAECAYVGRRLAAINDQLTDIHDELHRLEAHLV